MNRLLIISNRLPVTIQKRDGHLHVTQSIGGLATGLGSIYSQREALWLGWPGISGRNLPVQDREKIAAILKDIKCEPIFLSDLEFEKYYNGFCNKAIWPLFHYFSHFAEYDPAYWKGYVRVNRKFCDAICAVTETGDRIWIHDYQLMLVPGMVREKIPDARIGYFHHIPFPQYELFRLMPWRKEILEGLLGADLIGFHTFEYATYFFNSVRRILGYEQEMTWIKAGERQIKVDTFPMGIDYDRFSGHAGTYEVKKEVSRIRNSIPTGRILLSIDRLDYSKGVPLRLKAFDHLLETHPELKEQVILILVAVPSRTRIEQYARLRQEVEQLVGMINGKHATMCWTPVRYLFKSLPFNRLLALYRIADLALVTPVRDGMNLMAKEYLATKTDGNGMLVLSEFAGAAKELGEAILVNPNNTAEFAEAMYQGLTLTEPERQARVKDMQARLRRYDLARWTSDFLDVFESTRAQQQMLEARFMDAGAIRHLTQDYRDAGKRILFLDYDGTLVPISRTPEMAEPDPEILRILSGLTKDPATSVVIISGRDRTFLEHWFGSLDVGLIAEHGIWIRESGKAWEMLRIVSKEWKEEIRPILERYVDRTPRTFVEEKEFSLAWHYRNADSFLAQTRSGELREDLMLRTKSLRLALLEGSKVFEVKSADVNKGAAAQHWLKNATYDFVFAAGDDRTDEDVFSAVPPESLTVKVGTNQSRAHYSVRSVHEIRDLLMTWSTGTAASRRLP
jgi:trehalose 6-phosphate synthase/phosphatase